MEETGILENLAFFSDVLPEFEPCLKQGTVQKRPISGNTGGIRRGLRSVPHLRRVQREPLVFVLWPQCCENRVYPRSSSQCACGSLVSNSAGLLPIRLETSLRWYRRWFRKNWSNVK